MHYASPSRNIRHSRNIPSIVCCGCCDCCGFFGRWNIAFPSLLEVGSVKPFCAISHRRSWFSSDIVRRHATRARVRAEWFQPTGITHGSDTMSEPRPPAIQPPKSGKARGGRFFLLMCGGGVRDCRRFHHSDSARLFFQLGKVLRVRSKIF